MLRFLSFFGKILGYLIVAPITRIINWKQEWIPAIKNPLLKLSALELAYKIRKREIKASTVVKAYIERIKEVNGILNAMNEDRFDAALKEAEAADELADASLDVSELEEKYPLLGVPFTVKEVVGVAGLRQACGIYAKRDRKAMGDGTAVKLLKEAGAIPLGVTNLPEWSCSLETDNVLNGSTKNPYDTRRSPGGSSGGEAALISSASSVFGLGSDVAGSCRLPPLYCGIFGFKPTLRTVGVENFFPLPEGDPRVHDFNNIGIMARHCKDMRQIFKIISNNLKDLKLNTPPLDLDELTVYSAETFPIAMGMTLVDVEIQEQVTKVTEYLRLRGAVTHKLIEKIPNINDSIEISMVRLTSLKMFNVMENEKGETDFLPWELIKSQVGLSKYSRGCCEFEVMRRCRGFILPNKIEAWEQKGDAMQAALLELLDEKTVIVCPTFTDAAIYPSETAHKSTGMVYLVLANAFGLPAIHVPMGFNKNGLPIGVQIIAGRYMDRLCFDVAEELEKEFGGWIPHPRWA